jgi:hypothetical protein
VHDYVVGRQEDIMPAEIRVATTTDVPEMIELLLQDSQNRQAHNQALWALADDADKQMEEAVRFALTAEKQPFRQRWLVAELDGKLVGIIHSALLPVPPIYAGEWGDPGLIMPECFVTDDAPLGTLAALVEAAEADLRAAGAELLVASFVSGDEVRSCFEERGYKPITLYLAKAGFDGMTPSGDVRLASEDDIEGIVRRSAENRRILFALDAFWTTHPEADARFGNWMRKSLTLQDRDMLVAGGPDTLDGYIIAQPASRLHFPPAHDISGIGVVDDYFHRDYSDPDRVQDGGEGAASLLQAAEAAFGARGANVAMIVCPAAWTSKLSILEKTGYKTAIMWMVKR